MLKVSKKGIEKPISPHLTIYKPQISSVLSILHRVTGVINFVGIIAITWVFVFSVYFASEEFNVILCAFYEHFLGKIVLIGWSYSLFFHAFNGIRYLFWDFGMGFDLKVMHVTGWLSIMFATVLTVICWMIIFVS